MKTSGFSPTNSMPLWEEDGYKMPQSNAILRMLGVRHGYYTDDPIKAHAMDSICEYVEAMMPPLQAYMGVA